MTRTYGFLTDWQREYLKKEREKCKAKDRAVQDFYIRKTILKSLEDLTLVTSELEREQFNKTFKSEFLESFLANLFKRYSEPLGNKFPLGRIIAERPFMYMATDYKETVLKMLENAVQKAWGDDWLLGVSSKEYDKRLWETPTYSIGNTEILDTTIITDRNDTTIPKIVREKLGVTSQDKIAWLKENGKIIIRKVQTC